MSILNSYGSLYGSSTTKGKDIRTGLSEAMAYIISVRGDSVWSIQDDGYVNGTSERTVFSNSNGFSFMIINAPNDATSTNMNFIIGTDYNDSTHELNNIGFGNSGGGSTSNSSGFSGVSINPSSLVSGSLSAPYFADDFATTSTQTFWGIIVADDYLIVTVKDGSSTLGKWIYCGKFNTNVKASLNDTYSFCLVQNNIFNISTSFSGAAVLNTVTPSATAIWGHKVTSLEEKDYGFSGYLSNPAALDYWSPDSTTMNVSPIYIVRDAFNVNDVNITYPPVLYGHNRGTLKGIVYGANPTSGGAVWGDTTAITIDGLTKTYMYLGGTGVRTSSSGYVSSLAGWAAIE
jgi:hypothetical protein